MFRGRIITVLTALTVAALTAPCAVPAIVHAQALSVKVQPSTIEQRLDPGASLSGNLTVTNESGGTQTYYIRTTNITSQDENGVPVFSDSTSDDPLMAAAWIKPGVDSVTLAEGQSSVVPYTIEVPENASPGSYFAAFFVTREADKATETGAGVGFRVASIATLRVNGPVSESLNVKEFSVDRSVYNNQPISFSARVMNTGTVHQRPVGIITLTDMLGNELKIDPVLKLNDMAGVVMPNEERKFTMTWTWNTDHFLLGRYTATLSTLYGETDRTTVTNKVYFWVFPVRPIATSVGGLVIALMLIMLGLRAYVRNALRRAGVNAHSEEIVRIETFSRRLMRTLTWLALLIGLVFIGTVVFFA